MHSFSFGEIALIFGIVVILFGGSRLASIGKSLGEGIANFKKGLNGDAAESEETPKKELPKTKATAYQPTQVSSSTQQTSSHVKSEEFIDIEHK